MSVEYSKAPFPWFGAIGALKMLEIRQQKGVAGIFLSPLIRDKNGCTWLRICLSPIRCAP